MKSLRRGWRFHVVDLSTRLAHGQRGAVFRQGVMEIIEELDDEGDLRLLDVITTVRESLRLSSKFVRTTAVATIFVVASSLAAINLVDVHRDDVIAQNREQLLRYLSEVPHPPIVWTSAEQGRSCLELNKQMTFGNSNNVQSKFHMVSISLKLYCYPSNLLTMK